MPAFPPLNDPAAAVTLNDGHTMPVVGAGTWKLSGEDCVKAIHAALEAGYRHLDTAAIYGNEREIGRALRETSVPRGSVFLTTKLWNNAHENAADAFHASLDRLGLDYVDLYLIHWPLTSKTFVQAWRAMADLQRQGRIRSIGVSNFTLDHLATLRDETGIVPAVNQIEAHPWLWQPELAAYMNENGIQAQAWSPLMGGRWSELTEVQPIAERLGRSVPQIVLRWLLEQGFVVLPKSQSPDRLAANLDLFDFQLDPADRAAISALNRHERIGPDPDRFQEGTDRPLLDPAAGG